ncbi:MAG: hypothetical protein FJY73_07135 [Candidatus Eisenbacteria bacterium]|nr:hypothetical protein [Candidatus Eisenbacteria bacterium]
MSRAILLLLLFAALLSLACDGIDPVDLDAIPSPPGGVSLENGSRRMLLRWDFIDEVSPGVSFSGYKVYLKREDWDAFYVWSAFETKPGSASNLPLLQEQNSLVQGRMEVWLVDLTNGLRHSVYVKGVQNGKEGSASAIVDDVPYRLHTTIAIQEETRTVADWYIPGYATASYGAIGPDRIGYHYDEGSGKHYLRFRSIDGGGWLRLQHAGPSAAKEDAPIDGSGLPIGFHEDGALDRKEIGEHDYLFVWNTNGTTTSSEDDRFSRIWIRNIVSIPSDRKILIDCAYQPRANTPNL